MRTILTLLALLSISCGHPERYGCNIVGDKLKCLDGSTHALPVDGQDGKDGKDGKDGSDAEPCTVSDSPEGATISCPDGSSVEIFDGEDGRIIVCHRHRHGHRDCLVR